MMRAVVLAIVLALAACGDEPQQEAAAPEPASATTAESILKEPASEPTAGSAIPAHFHGVWDTDTGNCAAGSEMRLEVAADRIEYHESVGTLTAIEAADGGVLARLAMEGEGHSWQNTARLVLTKADEREALLVLHAPVTEIELRPEPRFRCPAR